MFVDDGESLHVCVMGVMRMLMTLCIRVVLAIHFPSSLHQDLNRHWATTFEEEEVRVLKPAAVLHVLDRLLILLVTLLLTPA